jgi:hypothetical protein
MKTKRKDVKKISAIDLIDLEKEKTSAHVMGKGIEDPVGSLCGCTHLVDEPEIGMQYVR